LINRNSRTALPLREITFLAVFSFLSAQAAELKTIPANDQNVFHTPENWVVENSNLETNSPGAYLKIGFAGTAFEMVVDTSAIVPIVDPTAASPPPPLHCPLPPTPPKPVMPVVMPLVTSLPTVAREYPKIGYQIDEGRMETAFISETNEAVRVPLATHLSPGNHQIKIILQGLGHLNRWDHPSDQLKIKAFRIEGKAKTIAPRLKPKSMVVYGDSITEGAKMLANANTAANEEWSSTWDALIAEKLGAEVSVVAYQAQGYEARGQGGVPSLLDSYSWIRKGFARAFSQPDYVFVLEGQNTPTTERDVIEMMTNIRRAYPKAKVFWGVPFSGVSRKEITDANKADGNSDSNRILFDLEAMGAKLVNDHSFDCIHPDVVGHALLAAKILANLQRTLEE
jgi:hypothetical protein